jgi:hypothetical protein
MPEIILYLTKSDSEIIRKWINSEPEVAWIVKDSQTDSKYCWRAVDHIPELVDQEYAIWHRGTVLTIPSGDLEVPDAIVLDPFIGWTQSLESVHASRPWFGSNLPGPYGFRFKEIGTESTPAIGRSGFRWHGNQFCSIGKPAPLVAIKWWRRLNNFLMKNSVAVPWPYPEGNRKHKAYAFPNAHRKILDGAHADANP